MKIRRPYERFVNSILETIRFLFVKFVFKMIVKFKIRTLCESGPWTLSTQRCTPEISSFSSSVRAGDAIHASFIHTLKRLLSMQVYGEHITSKVNIDTLPMQILGRCLFISGEMYIYNIAWVSNRFIGMLFQIGS